MRRRDVDDDDDGDDDENQQSNKACINCLLGCNLLLYYDGAATATAIAAIVDVFATTQA